MHKRCEVCNAPLETELDFYTRRPSSADGPLCSEECKISCEHLMTEPKRCVMCEGKWTVKDIKIAVVAVLAMIGCVVVLKLILDAIDAFGKFLMYGG